MKTVFILTLVASSLAGCQNRSRACINHAQPPDYPPMARQAAIQGDVLVSLQIASDGTVTLAKASAGHALLVKAAEESLLQWTFHTDRIETKSQLIQNVRVEFRIQGNPAHFPQTRVEYDFPERVRVTTQPPLLNPD